MYISYMYCMCHHHMNVPPYSSSVTSSKWPPRDLSWAQRPSAANSALLPMPRGPLSDTKRLAIVLPMAFRSAESISISGQYVNVYICIMYMYIYTVYRPIKEYMGPTPIARIPPRLASLYKDKPSWTSRGTAFAIDPPPDPRSPPPRLAGGSWVVAPKALESSRAGRSSGLLGPPIGLGDPMAAACH